MRYVWEYFQQDGKMDVTVSPLKDCSPYVEISENESPDTGAISYNPYLRYGSTMQKLCDLTSEPDGIPALFDLCSRVLVEADLMASASVERHEMQRLYELIRQGNYGNDVTKEFMLLSDVERERLLHSIWIAGKSSQKSSYVFAEAVLSNIQAAGVYQDRENPRKIIIFMGCKKEEKAGRMLRLLGFFLLPMELEYMVLWERPFGILGTGELMRLGEAVMMSE